MDTGTARTCAPIRRARPFSSTDIRTPATADSTGGSESAISSLGDHFQQPGLVDVQQDRDEKERENEKSEQHEPRQRLRSERPDVEEHSLQVEQQERDGD